MTSYPCVKDTESVGLAIPGAYLLPSLILDPDATNALALRDNGLYAPPTAVMPGARLYAAVAQAAIPNGSQILFGNMRWQSSNAAWTANAIVPQVSGLWLFGASIAFNTAAVLGDIRAEIITGGTLIAGDTASSFAAFTASPTTTETLCLNPVGIANISAGSTVIVQIGHNYPSVTTVIQEANGCEFWGHLLIPAS